MTMSDEAYVAYHGTAYLKGVMDSHATGMRIQIVLSREEDYKAFKEFRKHRKGKAGSGLYNCLTKAPESDVWYGPVELKFLRWAISSVNGAVVTFQIDDEAEWRRMRGAQAIDQGYEIRQMKPMEFMLVELDNEGKPVNVKQRAKVEAMARKRKWPKGGPQSIRAARLCQDKDFRHWVNFEHNKLTNLADEPPPVDDVAKWMRAICEIDTRAQLDHDPAALRRFEERIVRPYYATMI